MYTFFVESMTCAGCGAAITRAIRAADNNAEVRPFPETHRLEVISQLSSEHLLRILDDAGYSAEPIMEA